MAIGSKTSSGDAQMKVQMFPQFKAIQGKFTAGSIHSRDSLGGNPRRILLQLTEVF
jgi:hypothetical protein